MARDHSRGMLMKREEAQPHLLMRQSEATFGTKAFGGRGSMCWAELFVYAPPTTSVEELLLLVGQ